MAPIERARRYLSIGATCGPVGAMVDERDPVEGQNLGQFEILVGEMEKMSGSPQRVPIRI